jgi:2,3-bisphosphoglycerate-independent phosphoglycerate mutase
MNHKTYKKVVLVILDGFGIASYSHGNAIALANPEVLNFMVSQFPSLSLQASGPLVGLPWGEMGNSEVGHLNIGAGRIVGQDLPRINHAIQTREFFKNEAFLAACQHARDHKSKLHLVGMVSGGGVHSSDEHLYALLALAAEQGIKNVFIHMFTDGRDTGEKVALESIQKLKVKIAEIGVGRIATITGRFYAMDRGKHWDQTELTYQALVNGIGSSAYTPEDCVLDSYNQGVYDEMIKPTVIVEQDQDSSEHHPITKIQDNDAVIFFNFRQDRALQLTQAFVKPEIMNISSKHQPLNNVCFVTMTEYFFGLPVKVAFPTVNLQNNLAEYLSQHNLKQFHIAESEKYAHVTSFFNGGANTQFPGEERKIVKSPSNANNYSDHPEMSGLELTELLVEKIKTSDTNFFIANYANPDMVGHTGNLDAAIKAIKYIDRFLEKIMEAALEVDAALIITADHGNIEQMLNLKTGLIDKDHTTNPVPFLLIANEFRYPEAKQRNYLSLSARTPDGAISDIAPTILDLFGLAKPPEMNGVSLWEAVQKEFVNIP